ncbi:MAG: Phosphoglycerate mutase [Frankiales bacterium]|nr:Phosphoglycerate mutase [Frankiales bacterium]
MSLWVVRHGETEWSRTMQHTGRTDIPLTEQGEAQARDLAPRLRRDWALVLASPLQRAWRTAELAGLTPEPEPDLMEWDYGHAEGLTTEQLSAEKPWRVWDDPDLGETLEQVAERVRRVLARLPTHGDTCLVAHGHVLRILTAIYLELEPVDAQHLVLEPCGIGILGKEHDWPALRGWNL